MIRSVPLPFTIELLKQSTITVFNSLINFYTDHILFYPLVYYFKVGVCVWGGGIQVCVCVGGGLRKIRVKLWGGGLERQRHLHVFLYFFLSSLLDMTI